MNIKVSISGNKEITTIDEKYTVYITHLSYNNKSWTIYKRFSEFVELNNTLKSQGYKNILSFPFPKKFLLLQSKKDILLIRQEKLELYLKDLLSMDPLPPEVTQFIELDIKNDDSVNDVKIENSIDNSTKNKEILTEVNINNQLTNNPIDNKTNELTNNIGSVADNIPKKSFYNISSLNYILTNKSNYSIVSNEDIFIHSIKWIIFISTILLIYTLILFIYRFNYYIDVIVKNIYIYAISTRVIIETIIILTLLTISSHRIFGYIATSYLQNKFKLINGGFDMSIEWISFRVGLDRNEIIINGFTWKNPSLFKETPYFIYIKQVIIVFEVMSIVTVFISPRLPIVIPVINTVNSIINTIYLTIFNNTTDDSTNIKPTNSNSSNSNDVKKTNVINDNYNPIKITSIEIDSAKIYIEKGKKKAHGINLWAALGAADEDEEKDVQDYIYKSMAMAVDATTSVGRDIADTIIKYNPGTLIYNGFANIAKILHKKQSSNDNSKANEKLNTNNQIKSDNDEDDDDDIDYNDSDFNQTWKDSNIDFDDATKQFSTPTSPKLQTSSSSDSKKNSKSSDYIIEVNRITMRDIYLHAQDFISSSHVALNHASYITIGLLNMKRKELTCPGPSKHTNRRGLKSNQLLFRIINHVVYELLSTNQLSMLTLMTSAAANHTTNAMLDVATLTTKGVTESIYNYNPIEIYNNTTKTLLRAVSSKSNIERSPSLTNLGYTAIKLRLIKFRDLIDYENKLCHTIVCELSLYSDKIEYNNLYKKYDIIKTSTRTKDREDEIVFQEQYEFDYLISLNTYIRIDVYESNLFSNHKFICQCIIPLQSSISPTSGINNDFIGIQNEIVKWHTLYNKNDSKYENKIFGQVKLGIALY